MHLQPLLDCPLCHSLLASPTTLRCGHSLCAYHTHAACPVPLCSSPNSPTLPRIDVTLNNLISLVRAHSHPDPSPSPPSPHRRRRHSPAFEKDLATELTCQICFMLLHHPVTTPCQHTFCFTCLHRALDHSPLCPLCRHTLPPYPFFHEHPPNKTLLAVLLHAFPDAYAERAQHHHDARLDTPIFVCQLSFPGMPTLLHFFEPRYRLMLRRCLQSPTPRFGMVMPPRPAPSSGPSSSPGNDYGTMLEIRSVQMLPDGRSMVETWGTHRFRIVERGSLDGYMVGRVERIQDYPDELDDDDDDSPPAALTEPTPVASSSAIDDNSVDATAPLFARIASSLSNRSPSPPPAPRPPTNAQLMATCHAFLTQLRAGTAPWVVQRLNHTYGPMPTDPGGFSFWVALVLPIDESEKAKLLPIRSPRMRLRLVVHWIEQLNSNWWFSSGCVVL